MTITTRMTALGCAGLLAAAPLHAQDASDAAEAQVLLLVPLELTKVSDLDFGTVISSPAAGTVVIPADGSARSATGGVVPVASDPGLAGDFYTAATVGQEVLFVLTAPTTLDNGAGDSISVLAMTMDGPNFRYADSDGVIRVRVGGILWLNANQPDGRYEGEFNLYAEYR